MYLTSWPFPYLAVFSLISLEVTLVKMNIALQLYINNRKDFCITCLKVSTTNMKIKFKYDIILQQWIWSDYEWRSWIRHLASFERSLEFLLWDDIFPADHWRNQVGYDEYGKKLLWKKWLQYDIFCKQLIFLKCPLRITEIKLLIIRNKIGMRKYSHIKLGVVNLNFCIVCLYRRKPK